MVTLHLICHCQKMADTPAVDRVSWFRSSLEGSTTGPTDEEMHLLVSAYTLSKVRAVQLLKITGSLLEKMTN